MRTPVPCIAIACGDPTGIGPELAWKLAAEVISQPHAARPMLVGDAQALDHYRQRLAIAPQVAQSVEQVCTPGGMGADFRPGQLCAAAGRATVSAIETALELVQAGRAYAILAAPHSETAVNACGVAFSGYGGPHRGGYGSASPSGYPGVGAIQQSGGIPSVTVQGGAIRSFPFGPEVESVEVILSTEGRNLQARIELLQGPDNVKQSIDLEEDDGYNRPFVCTFETPGYGHVVRIVNNGTIEFPLTASVIPRTFARPGYANHVVLGGRIGGYGYGGQSGQSGMGRGRASLRGYDDQRWYDPVGAGAMSYEDRGGGYGGYDERRGGDDNGRSRYQDTREYAMSYGGRGQAVDSRPWWERA